MVGGGVKDRVWPKGWVRDVVREWVWLEGGWGYGVVRVWSESGWGLGVGSEVGVISLHSALDNEC